MTRPAPGTCRGHSKPPDSREFLNPGMSEPQHPTGDQQAGIAQDSPLEKPLPTAASKWSPSEQAQGHRDREFGGVPGFWEGDQCIPAGSAAGGGCRSPGIWERWRQDPIPTSLVSDFGSSQLQREQEVFWKRGRIWGDPSPPPAPATRRGLGSPPHSQSGGLDAPGILPGDWGGMFSQGGDTDGSGMGAVILGAIPIPIQLLSRIFLGSPRCSWEAEAALPVAQPDPPGWHWGRSAWPGKHTGMTGDTRITGGGFWDPSPPVLPRWS